jgi:hypothetical protein
MVAAVMTTQMQKITNRIRRKVFRELITNISHMTYAPRSSQAIHQTGAHSISFDNADKLINQATGKHKIHG